jgi:hypothetical protein
MAVQMGTRAVTGNPRAVTKVAPRCTQPINLHAYRYFFTRFQGHPSVNFESSGLTANQVRHLLATRPREEIEELMLGNTDDFGSEGDGDSRDTNDQDTLDVDDADDAAAAMSDRSGSPKDDRSSSNSGSTGGVFVDGAIVEALVDDYVAAHGEMPPDELVDQVLPVDNAHAQTVVTMTLSLFFSFFVFKVEG